MPEKIQVLVVGAGPVGLAMAVELLRHGIQTRLIDKASERSIHSKALAVWPRTLELLHASGGADTLVAAGMKLRAATIFAGERQLLRAAFDNVDSPYAYALVVPQSETERLLEAQLERAGGRLDRRCTLTAFDQDNKGVTVHLANEDGRNEVLRTDWVIGCDGAHSTVRHALALPFSGVTTSSSFILADVRLAGTSVAPDELSLFWHPEGVLGLIPITKGWFRIVADLGDVTSENPDAAPTLAEVQNLLDRRGPGGLTATDPMWLSIFRINERKVAEYRVGRVFLAGDAAHIHSPAGGQGMNTGIQDACNLAWKLALVCRGIGRAAPLLDSYSIERSYVGDIVLRNASNLTRIATMRNPVAQTMRNLAASLLGHVPAVKQRFVDMLAEITIGYPRSPLSRQTADAPTGHGRLKSGERAPDLPIIDPLGVQTRLFDWLGPTRFTVLTSTGDQSVKAIDEAIGRYGDHAALVRSALKAGNAAKRYSEDALYLIRPDGYVGLIARRGDCNAVIAYLSEFLEA